MTLLAAQLQRSANEFGDAVAILSSDDGYLTYQELHHQAHYVSTVLRECGFQSGERVAILLPHGIELAVSILGVASHTACVLLDPLISHHELERVLSESEAVAIICCAKAPANCAQIASRVGIDSIMLQRSDLPRGKFELNRISRASSGKSPRVHSADHAVILCTSGSTSLPKLVPQSHQSLLSAASDLANWFELGTADRSLGCMPLFHGNGLFVGFLPVLVSGGSFVCMDSIAPAEFFRCLRTYKPSWLSTIPTYLQALLRQARQYNPPIGPHRLRFIRAGSEYLAAKTKRDIEDLFSVPVITGYGSCEAAHITNNPLPPQERREGSVGLPCGNEVKVIDEQGNTLGVGEVGEVVVRGNSVTAGYLNDPMDNADLFADGWLRTCDLGRFDDAGYLTLVGRRKHIISRGGESISPLEIQDVMLEHPLVAAAAVFGVNHPTLGENVAAAVMLQPQAKLSQPVLQRYLGQRLSARKVPYRIIELKQFPMNSIGKIDGARLLEIFQATCDSDVAPRTPIEHMIARIWRETLGIENIGVTDHFMDLGGDSLSALNVLGKLNAQFGIDLQPADIIVAATIENLAGVVVDAWADVLPQQAWHSFLRTIGYPATEENGNLRALLSTLSEIDLQQLLSYHCRGKRHSGSDLIPRRETSGMAPASFSELGLWFNQQLDPEDVSYHAPLAIRFTGPMKVSILEESLRVLVRRHELLRTAFTTVADEPMRSILDEISWQLETEDILSKGKSRNGCTRQLEVLVQDEIRKPFDLSTPPLFRSRLFQIGAQSHLLVLTFHHIITDAWSASILVRELCALYRAGMRQKSLRLPDLPLQYADYASWQRGQVRVFEGQLDFWRKQLAGQPTSFKLPVSQSIPVYRSLHGSTEIRITSGQLGTLSRQLSQGFGTTQFVVLQAAFKTLLYLHSGATDISIGTPAANRGHCGLDNLVGCFINMLVLRSDLSGNPTFEGLIEREQERCYGAYLHQEVPFQTVVADIRPKRVPGVTPLFQMAFSLRAPTAMNLSGTGLRGERIPLHNGTAKYELSVEVIGLDNGELELRSEFSNDRFDSSAITEMLKSYEELLKGIAMDPRRHLDDLRL